MTMYSPFDLLFSPPVRTVYVVSENQLNDLKVKQKHEQIKELKQQQKDLDVAYDRQKSCLADSLANLEAEVKELTPAKD